MTDGYANLSHQILENIFKDCSFTTLKRLSTVCRHWNTIITSNFRKQFILNVNKVISNESFELSNGYQCLSVSNLIMTNNKDKVFQVLEMQDDVIGLKLLDMQLENVLKILQSLKTPLKYLEIKDYTFDDIEEDLDFPFLSEVEHLKVQSKYKNIITQLKKLKTLQMVVNYSAEAYELIKTIVKNNKDSFQSLQLSGCLQQISHLEFLTDLTHLKHFSMRENSHVCTNNLRYLTNCQLESLELELDNEDDVIQILQTHYNSLRKVVIHFPKCTRFEVIWSIPNLEYLEVGAFQFEGESPIKTNIHLKSLILTAPVLNAIVLPNYFGEDMLQLNEYIKSAPNLEFLKIVYQSLNFNFFENCKTLRYLELNFVNFLEPLSVDLPKLECLKLDFVSTLSDDFFRYFGASKLKHLLITTSRESKGITMVQLGLEKAELISLNFPRIEKLTIHGNVTGMCNELEYLLDNLKFLECVRCNSAMIATFKSSYPQIDFELNKDWEYERPPFEFDSDEYESDVSEGYYHYGY